MTQPPSDPEDPKRVHTRFLDEQSLLTYAESIVNFEWSKAPQQEYKVTLSSLESLKSSKSSDAKEVTSQKSAAAKSLSLVHGVENNQGTKES